MKTRFAFCAMAVPAMLAAADVSGAWTGTVGSPVYLVLKQEGNHLSGTAGPTAGEQVATFQGGTVDGDHVAFRVGPYQLDLKVEGDRMSGAATSGDSAMQVALRRVDSIPKRAEGAPLPGFEVASVKQAPPPPVTGGIRTQVSVTPGRLVCTNLTLRRLIMRAYSLKEYQVTGPDWIGTDLYSIEARMPADTTGDDLLLMMQRLLAERFQLSVHRTTKEMAGYELVVGKGGPRMKPVEFGRGSTRIDGGTLTATGVLMRSFADMLSGMLDRPVLDKTGLQGAYDFTLEWQREERRAEGGDAAARPSLFTAVQEQLGLRLEGKKAPVEVLVVDHAERVPVSN
ncbi:MAG: TIGR03435 family protein [Acidobacteria bacterium]|nr:TIGR03435 family protein [Acidobacteriota bacterium]